MCTHSFVISTEALKARSGEISRAPKVGTLDSYEISPLALLSRDDKDLDVTHLRTHRTRLGCARRRVASRRQFRCA